MGEQGEGRTYGIWGFVAMFAMVALVGVVLLVLDGGSGGPTVVVPVEQTLPDRATSTTAFDEPLPDAVSEVLRDGGTTSFVLEPPAGVTDDGSWSAVVAPMRVTVSPDGEDASLSIECARSSEEFVGQVIVTEGDTAVTFAAVALVPAGGPGCATGSAPRTLEVPLSEPLADRAVVVVPAGTEVPELQQD